MCLCFHCLRPGISNSVNFQVNMIDILWLVRGPFTTITGGIWWQPIINPGVDHCLSVERPTPNICLTACKPPEVHQSFVFDFLLVFFFVPCEIRLHRFYARLYPQENQCIEVSYCQLCWRRLKGPLVWPLDPPGRVELNNNSHDELSWQEKGTRQVKKKIEWHKRKGWCRESQRHGGSREKWDTVLTAG